MVYHLGEPFCEDPLDPLSRYLHESEGGLLMEMMKTYTKTTHKIDKLR